MNITIIGAGAVGAALAEGWHRAGHDITLAVRDPQKPEVQTLAKAVNALVVPAHAVAAADAFVLAVPWDAAEAAVRALGDLGGTPLIDATNPLVFADGRLSLVQPDGLSGAEHIAGWAQNAAVVKTLNQVGAEMMSAQKVMAAAPSMFIAGDDAAANAVAATLVSDLGFEALEAGDLTQARHLEHFAMVWINQAIMRGFGRDWAFGALRNGVTV
ncbi:MAG: NAD(P)-binding domain-containing protein [Pseudomonadota bacterium]